MAPCAPRWSAGGSAGTGVMVGSTFWLALGGAVVCSGAAAPPDGQAPATCSAGAADVPRRQSHHLETQVSLLQSTLSVHGGRSLVAGAAGPATDEDRHSRGGAGSVSCAKLYDNVTFFTVRTRIGTPEQIFSTVADTGSDSLVVPSCICSEVLWECSLTQPCYRSNKSHDVDFVAPASNNFITLSYGSGNIEALVASDVVRVADLEADMKHGVLLMVSQQLRISGPFDGILGLGLPSKGAWYPSSNGSLVQVPDFLPSAHVRRFSMCFNDNGMGGVMRIEPPMPDNSLVQIGHSHWGLGIWGIGAGAANATPAVCGPDTMWSRDQLTPCGGITDTGTTLLTGPKDQIIQIFASLCDVWPRCAEKVLQQAYMLSEMGIDSNPLSPKSKSDSFQTLLFQCDDWLNSSVGLKEVPSLFLNVSGVNKTQMLELSSWSWVTETVQEQFEVVVKKLYDVLPVYSLEPTNKTKRICTPSFGVGPMQTTLNGPVWILGMPLFYQYQVVFDLEKPPKIGFVNGTCGECIDGSASEGDGDASLLGTAAGAKKAPKVQGRMRKMAGQPRESNVRAIREL